MKQSDKSSIVTNVARGVSHVLSPPVVMLVVGFVVAAKQVPLQENLIAAAVHGLFVSIFPSLFVAYLLMTGQVTDIHLKVQAERLRPYLFSIGSTAVGWLIFWLMDAPALWHCLALFTIAQLSLGMVINLYWLISVHTTSITTAVLLVGLVYGWLTSLWVVPLLLLVCTARLYLKRHTLGQVLGGIGLSAVLVWLLVANCV